MLAHQMLTTHTFRFVRRWHADSLAKLKGLEPGAVKHVRSLRLEGANPDDARRSAGSPYLTGVPLARFPVPGQPGRPGLLRGSGYFP